MANKQVEMETQTPLRLKRIVRENTREEEWAVYDAWGVLLDKDEDRDALLERLTDHAQAEFMEARIRYERARKYVSAAWSLRLHSDERHVNNPPPGPARPPSRCSATPPSDRWPGGSMS